MKEVQHSLFKNLCALKTAEEFELFFADLCTPQELEALQTRWACAQLIAQGLTIREVNTITSASTTTITRVNRSLHYGKGYRLLLDKMDLHL
ncbi:transposase [Candidatus Berkiella cookevillensis]|uniref:Transposase n=1 Tax=Candidatus Berkiella cookevillensis TaxID=437022 RepID=A0A0Q9YGB3_9GAMM|nr:YerC/YecD family TrpR-related protein [Candidatus Berkiella cookevillensis]MCS5707571.1 transposase [Candidatus Berkiella cookevillensis]